MKKLTGILILILISGFAFAQQRDRPIVQFSGIVHNADSLRGIVPYVTIVNTGDKRQVYLSNYQGYFSFAAHEQDTLKFSSVGYGTSIIVIPANVTKHSYVAQVLLKPEIINLPLFRVFPWATTEEFTKEFISMKIADDDLEIARKNISHSSIMALERTLHRDGPEVGSFQDFHNGVVNSHSITNPLLNPFNWGNIIREISEGDKARGVTNSN